MPQSGAKSPTTLYSFGSSGCPTLPELQLFFQQHMVGLTLLIYFSH